MRVPMLTLAELAERFERSSDITASRAAIGVRDPQIARYARVLEYGSLAGQKPWPTPGPSTTLAVDPETGAQVVVSAKSPQGFIRTQAPQFPALIAAQLQSAADWLHGEEVQAHLANALARATPIRVRLAYNSFSGRPGPSPTGGTMPAGR